MAAVSYDFTVRRMASYGALEIGGGGGQRQVVNAPLAPEAFEGEPVGGDRRKVRRTAEQASRDGRRPPAAPPTHRSRPPRLPRRAPAGPFRRPYRGCAADRGKAAVEPIGTRTRCATIRPLRAAARAPDAVLIPSRGKVDPMPDNRAAAAKQSDSPTNNSQAPGLGRRDGQAHQARPHRLVRRLGGREATPHRGGGRQGHPDPAEPGEAARLLPPPLEPERRRAHRAPHLHLHADQRRRGSQQQLDGPQGRRTPSSASSSTAR